MAESVDNVLSTPKDGITRTRVNMLKDGTYEVIVHYLDGSTKKVARGVGAEPREALADAWKQVPDLDVVT
jgi:hypothetical protein